LQLTARTLAAVAGDFVKLASTKVKHKTAVNKKLKGKPQ
jgi:hypothetical protein